MNGFFMLSLMSAAVIGSGMSAGSQGAISLASDSFKNGEYLEKDYTCEGKDISPELHWSFRGNAVSFAVTCDDPDAPGGNFVHWVIYNIPGTDSGLPKGFPKKQEHNGILQGTNDFPGTGYNGPCPPRGRPHRYIFTVYALDTRITDKNLSLADLKKAVKGHVLASAAITGMYKR